VSAWVVDASVALKWVIAEEGSEAATALSGESLSSPSLLLGECANALWVKAHRRELTTEEVLERLALLRGAPVLLVPIEDLIDDATRLAIDLDHPVYDCLYLALALRQDSRLITADQQFARTVSRDRALANRVVMLGELSAS
jgi:predicted nucleic acid-binding protein